MGTLTGKLWRDIIANTFKPRYPPPKDNLSQAVEILSTRTALQKYRLFLFFCNLSVLYDAISTP